ncbi:MAG: acyl-phosphate glycerol 3-phosphate acyltransferase [Anaerolineaceae bacterium 4572_32.2]|nr:MAG: acyl-phosphate glycerol 3-phosphate acyltransferase [Anaerolineaceae bacterium 4572_32.2]HEY74082.1 glycerol-3-phosphate 1-O-acyltransferase PlsY [Thermoflexia bacterium]
MFLITIATLVSAYLLGSIPFGLLMVRVTTGKDVREVGSGRIGGTNVLRAAGHWVALLSALCDLGKGLVAVLLARAFVGTPVIEALAGLLAVVGHNYSIFIDFKGGAGTATTIGGAIALWPWNGAILIGWGIAIVVTTRYASMGSITIALLLPVIYALRAWSVDAPWNYLIHGLGTAALTLWALRPNIGRLRAGNERRVSLGKKKATHNNG